MEDKISPDNIKEAIENSGYLIEQRVEAMFEKYEYGVAKNEIYIDDETKKAREIDLNAISVYPIGREDTDGFMNFFFVTECENNKWPVVFFRSDSPLKTLFTYDIKMAGIPLDIRQANRRIISIQDFIGLEKFHHYCKGFYSTQYCSFQPPKRNGDKWIALHPESQHNSFSSLVKCTNHFIEENYKHYEVPRKGEKESFDIYFYYPLIILQGDLMECFYDKGNLLIEPRDHIQFRKQGFNKEELETYQVDVIRESYLEEYLKMINKENKRIVRILKQNKQVLNSSVERVRNKMGKAKSRNEIIKILKGDS